MIPTRRKVQRPNIYILRWGILLPSAPRFRYTLGPGSLLGSIFDQPSEFSFSCPPRFYSLKYHPKETAVRFLVSFSDDLEIQGSLIFSSTTQSQHPFSGLILKN